jgi:hypothetical protein
MFSDRAFNIQRGYDPPNASLKLLLDMVESGKPLAGLTKQKAKRVLCTKKWCKVGRSFALAALEFPIAPR